MDRAREKRQKQQMIEARQSAKPVNIQDAVQAESELLNFQRVSLQGSFIPDKNIFLVNKLHRGQIGYEVLSPFKLKSTHQVVIISRGWTPIGFDKTDLPNMPPPSGEMHLTGVVHVPSGRSFFVDQRIRKEDWPLRLHHLKMESIAPFFEVPLFPYVIRLEENLPGALQPYWPVFKTNPERSTSYAYQWFSMAGLLVLLTLVNCTNIKEVLRTKGRKPDSSDNR